MTTMGDALSPRRYSKILTHKDKDCFFYCRVPPGGGEGDVVDAWRSSSSWASSVCPSPGRGSGSSVAGSGEKARGEPPWGAWVPAISISWAGGPVVMASSCWEGAFLGLEQVGLLPSIPSLAFLVRAITLVWNLGLWMMTTMMTNIGAVPFVMEVVPLRLVHGALYRWDCDAEPLRRWCCTAETVMLYHRRWCCTFEGSLDGTLYHDLLVRWCHPGGPDGTWGSRYGTKGATWYTKTTTTRTASKTKTGRKSSPQAQKNLTEF